MNPLLGITFAFIALLSWGVGDFLIQKTTRKFGSWKALFFIGIIGFVILLPFVVTSLKNLEPNNWFLLSILGIVAIFTALFDFEALRQGKIAVVEPIIGLELPLTVGLSIVLANEHPNLIQFCLMILVFLGILCIVTTNVKRWHYHKRLIEKGVILAGIGAIGMALTNFLVGTTSQNISPLIAIWFTHSLIALVCFIYLLFKKQSKKLFSDLKSNPSLIIGQSLLDNIAWISFAFATTFTTISVATTISESYIALAALLGIVVNKEKLRKHQVFGIVVTIIGVLAFAYFSS